MLSDDELAQLPDVDELAFVQLEKKFRTELNEALDRIESSSAADALYHDYISHTIAMARALDLDILREWETPGQGKQLYEQYRRFIADVDHYVIQIQIRYGKRNRSYSVKLDHATREKIRHYLNKIKETLDVLDVPTAKKEALVSKLNAFVDEVDRDRTRFDAYAALALEAATTANKMARKLKPLQKLLEPISKLLGNAKEAERTVPRLSGPEERKRLEPPRRQLMPPKADLDDEIPF